MPAEVDSDIQIIPHIDKVVHFMMFGCMAMILWWDMLRSNIFSAGAVLPIAVVVVALFGGVIEVVQDNFTESRSGDWWDWAADIAGAVVIPLAFYGLVRRAKSNYELNLKLLPRGGVIPDCLYKLYHEAFPVEERRDWSDIVRRLGNKDSLMNMTVIYHHSVPVGFITWWCLENVIYVEHFAMSGAIRGKGLGGRAIRCFAREATVPLVLEVELPQSGDMARRRIAFYERSDFCSHPEFDYVQPPYGTGLPSVPLMLMTTGGEVNLVNIAKQIHHVVYGVSD